MGDIVNEIENPGMRQCASNKVFAFLAYNIYICIQVYNENCRGMDSYHIGRSIVQFNRLYHKTSLKYNTTMTEFQALNYNVTDLIIGDVYCF